MSAAALPDSFNDEFRLLLLADRQGWSVPDSAAALVLGLDVQALSQRGRVAAISVVERAKAALDAVQVELISALAADERAEHEAALRECPALLGHPRTDSARELVAHAMGVSPLAAAARIDESFDLRERLPLVWAAQRAGRVTCGSARALVQATGQVPHPVAQQVADQVLPLACQAPPGRVRRAASLLAARLDPAGAIDRHENAYLHRRVTVSALPDGMASLWWTADAATIASAFDHIDDAARQLQQAAKAAGAPLSIDAARSDALSYMLLTGTCCGTPACSGDGPEHAVLSHRSIVDQPNQRPPSRRRRPVIAVHVELTTLVGADGHPAEVPGLGFIPAETARTLAVHGDWQMFLHSADGRLAAVGTTAYTPTDAMVSLVVARDRTCRFPGCAQPAHRCDIDHVVPYNHLDPESGGRTEPDNLQALCRRHHNLKTSRHWNVTSNDDGSTDWTGPHGLRARTEHNPDPPL